MGAVMEDNVFVNATAGYAVKIGGTGTKSWEGSDGLTFRRNTLVNNSLFDGGCDLMLATGSDDLVVEDNTFWCQQTPGFVALSNVKMASW